MSFNVLVFNTEVFKEQTLRYTVNMYELSGIAMQFVSAFLGVAFLGNQSLDANISFISTK